MSIQSLCSLKKLKYLSLLLSCNTSLWGCPGGSGKETACQCTRRKSHGSLRESGRAPGVGNSNPLQYSCLENSMERGAWWATVQGVTKTRTWLSDWAFHTSLYWVGQKVHLDFSIRAYGNIWVNFLTKPMYFRYKVPYQLCALLIFFTIVCVVFLITSFDTPRFSTLIKSNLFIFNFVTCTFWGNEDLPLCFLLRIL